MDAATNSALSAKEITYQPAKNVVTDFAILLIRSATATGNPALIVVSDFALSVKRIIYFHAKSVAINFAPKMRATLHTNVYFSTSM
jgi:hypothetical protein